MAIWQSGKSAIHLMAEGESKFNLLYYIHLNFTQRYKNIPRIIIEQ